MSTENTTGFTECNPMFSFPYVMSVMYEKHSFIARSSNASSENVYTNACCINLNAGNADCNQNYQVDLSCQVYNFLDGFPIYCQIGIGTIGNAHEYSTEI